MMPLKVLSSTLSYLLFFPVFSFLLVIDTVRSMTWGQAKNMASFVSSPCRGSWKSHHARPPWANPVLWAPKTKHLRSSLSTPLSQCLEKCPGILPTSHSHMDSTPSISCLKTPFLLGIQAWDLWEWFKDKLKNHHTCSKFSFSLEWIFLSFKLSFFFYFFLCVSFCGFLFKSYDSYYYYIIIFYQ